MTYDEYQTSVTNLVDNALISHLGDINATEAAIAAAVHEHQLMLKHSARQQIVSGEYGAERGVWHIDWPEYYARIMDGAEQTMLTDCQAYWRSI